MALRDIVKIGDPKLRKKCRKVTEIDDRLITLLDDLAQTMYSAGGVGLAAPQVGILKRVAVVDIGDGEGLYELINPVITFQEGGLIMDEGCLSVPEERGYVKRPDHIKVEAFDRDGSLIEYEAFDFLAKAMSHEIDHLDGILFTDKIEHLTQEQITEVEAILKEKFGSDDEDAESDAEPDAESDAQAAERDEAADGSDAPEREQPLPEEKA